MYKPDLALDNPQWFIYHKIEPNQIIYIMRIQICQILETKDMQDMRNILSSKNILGFRSWIITTNTQNINKFIPMLVAIKYNSILIK